MVRIAAVLAVGILTLWFVVEEGVAAVAAKGSNPALLAGFDPADHPEAGSRLARIYLASNLSGKAADLAHEAALADPLNIRTLRVLGLSLEPTDKKRSADIMRVAARLGWRDTPVSLWILRDAAIHGDLPRLMDQIDALARRQVQPEIVGQIFHAGLNDARTRQAFAERLGENPPWRGAFFINLEASLARPLYGPMEDLLDRLSKTNAPPSAHEHMYFIRRMMQTGYGDRARAYWARTSGIAPAALARAPFDPDFRFAARREPDAPTSPFEWQINPDAGQFAYFRDGEAGKVLEINPGMEAGVTLVSQGIVLRPGTYRVAANIEGAASHAPVGWQVKCAPSGQPLIRTFAQRGNELSGITVTVPQGSCDAQSLDLVTTDRLDTRAIVIRSVSIR